MTDRRLDIALWTTLGLSAGLWIIGLRHVEPSSLGGYGLLGSLPILWYAGCAGVIAIATLLAVQGERKRHALWFCSAALLVLIVHGTPAIDYSLPRYTWTFKHIGVIDVLDTSHRAPRSADIYFNWPGFFTAAVWLHRATGLGLYAMAKWAPPAFEAMATAGVYYFARGITDDVRISRLTAVLYLLANWIGQDYFSPQALAYVLGIVLVGAVVRVVRASREDTAGDARRGLMVVIALSWVSVVTSHQLTPVVVLLDVALILLVVGGRDRFLVGPGGWVLLGVLAVSEIVWVILALPYLQKSGYALLTLDPLSGASSAPTVPSVISTGRRLRGDAVDLLYFGLFAVAGIWGVLTWRRQRMNRVVLGLAIAPPLVLLVQSYGGEGQLRTYLFAVPFLAYLVADALLTITHRGRRIAVTVAGVAVLAVCFAFAYYGQEEVNIVSGSDVAAIRWFYAHAPAGTGPVYLAPNAPTRLNRAYLNYPLATDALPTLLSDAEFVRGFDAAATVSYMRSLHRSAYLIITPSQERYLSYFGIATRARVASLLAGLDRAPGLQRVYASSGAFIWRVRGV